MKLGGFQLLEIRSSLPDKLVMYADKLSMAHSLEARVPYLDRTVVELRPEVKCRFQDPRWHAQMVAPTGLPNLFTVTHSQT